MAIDFFNSLPGELPELTQDETRKARIGSFLAKKDRLPPNTKDIKNTASLTIPKQNVDSGNSFDSVPPTRTEDEIRKARIQNILAKSRQLQPNTAEISYIDRLAIIKQQIETIPPQFSQLQVRLANIAEEDADHAALIKEQLIISEQKEKKALEEVSLHLESISQRSQALFDSVFKDLASVREDMKRLAVLDKRLESQIEINSQSYAHFKQEIDKELLVQKSIQGKIQICGERIEASKQELDLLQRNIIHLKNDLNESNNSLLELQLQEGLLENNIAALEREIQDLIESRNETFRWVLIASAVAAVAMITFVGPAILAGGQGVGVAAGCSEISFGLALSGEGASLTWATAGGAAGAIALASSKNSKRDHKQENKIDQEPPRLNSIMTELLESEEKAERLDQMANIHNISQFINVVQYPISKTIEFGASAIKETGKAVCNVHPTVHAGCTYTANKIKDVYQAGANYLSEPLGKVANAYKSAKSIYAEDNLNRFDIPIEVSNQVFDDGLNIFVSAACAMSGTLIPVRTIKSANKTSNVTVPEFLTHKGIQQQAVSFDQATLTKALERLPSLPNSNQASKSLVPKELLPLPNSNQASKTIVSKKSPRVPNTEKASKAIASRESPPSNSNKGSNPSALNQLSPLPNYSQEAIIAISEKQYINSIASSLKEIKLPKGFSPHLNSFLNKDLKFHPFEQGNLGASGKGKVKGLLLYQQVSEEAFFVMRKSKNGVPMSPELKKQTYSWPNLHFSKGITQQERLQAILDSISEFSKQEKLKNFYIAWNPNFYPLASAALIDSPFQILGIGKFSAGKGLDPHVLMKLKAPKG